MTDGPSNEAKKGVYILQYHGPCTMREAEERVPWSHAALRGWFTAAVEEGLAHREERFSPNSGRNPMVYSTDEESFDDWSPSPPEREPQMTWGDKEAEEDHVFDEGCFECGAGSKSIEVSIERRGESYDTEPYRVTSCVECGATRAVEVNHIPPADGKGNA